MNGSGDRRTRIWLIRLAMVLAAAIVLGRLGPFGTFTEVPTASRYSYWIGLTLLMWLQSIAALALLNSVQASRSLPAAAQLVMAALAGAVPTAFEVAWAEMLLRVERDLGLVDIAQIFGDVALLSVPLLLATHLLVRPAHGSADAEPKPTSTDDVSWLMARLRPERRGRLLALQSEDHYVRVHTERGTELVHMRFGDAVTRLAPHLGRQVHRSWWVATDAVRLQKREGDRIILELSNGTHVPVSRSYAVGARQAGVITGP